MADRSLLFGTIEPAKDRFRHGHCSPTRPRRRRPCPVRPPGASRCLGTSTPPNCIPPTKVTFVTLIAGLPWVGSLVTHQLLTHVQAGPGVSSRMGGMFRTLFAPAPAASLLLFLATAVLLVRSYEAPTRSPLPRQWVSWETATPHQLWLRDGSIGYGRTVWQIDETRAMARGRHEDKFAFPLWVGLVPALIVVPIFVRKRLSASRGRSGFCRACGYDLRASPERCPECGAPVRTQ